MVDDCIVLGGTSAIAAALRAGDLPRATYVVRKQQAGPGTVTLSDYGEVSPGLIAGHATVINCIGVTQGDPALLERVNIDLARQLAHAAREAGARRFIHVSSFSVYGSARRIDASTPAAPTTPYGRSKLAGDEALLALASERFSPVIVRLPLVYGPADWGKLGRLLRLWRRTRVFAAPAGDVARSMIGTDLAAQVIARLTREDRCGIVHAADPEPFSYRLVQRASLAGGRRLALVGLPGWAQRAIGQMAPDLSLRLFSDSLLAQEANLAARYGLPSRLADDIAHAQF